MQRTRANKVLVMMATASLAGACLVPSIALATDVDQLKSAYSDAVEDYESALFDQDMNAAKIVQAERTILQAEDSRTRAQNELDETAISLYKDTRGNNALINMLLDSEDLQDAIKRYEMYEKVERSCQQRIVELAQKRDETNDSMVVLEIEKAAIEARVKQTRFEAEEAHKALKAVSHADGARYHQVQGNGENCGATSFIVGVNILLNQNRYTDNVKVWRGAGFNGDSTNALAARGAIWLRANGLGDKIRIEEVAGDVHKTSELQQLLEDGNVVVISSGSGSVWNYTGGKKAGNLYPDGHWVVFYHYDNGVFYCNNSAVNAKYGAGCTYTKSEMQQWLDGRGNHFATVMSLKQ